MPEKPTLTATLQRAESGLDKDLRWAERGLDEAAIRRLAARFDARAPEALLEWALRRWGQRLMICTSFQAGGVVIVDMAVRIEPSVRIVTLDTGRLPQETHDLIERVRERYGVDVEMLFPDGRELGQMLAANGPNFFYRSVEARLECCRVRKVEPLRKVLGEAAAWVTGLRRSQASSRARVAKVELDHAHGGIVKLNPLADWSDARVWAYIEEHALPYHDLYDRGYTSIGCAPCTRPVAPGAEARSGRWWWERCGPKECGLHGSSARAGR
jgi:thioredoxin-dependent adenylylsulfate APS reductase